MHVFPNLVTYRYLKIAGFYSSSSSSHHTIQNNRARKQPSRASIFAKFRTLVALPKSYLSIKFGTIPTKIEGDISDSQSKFVTFFVTPIGKTIDAIGLKFSRAIC